MQTSLRQAALAAGANGMIVVPPFLPDSRGNRLVKSVVVRRKASAPSPRERWIYLCGPLEVVRQIQLITPTCAPVEPGQLSFPGIEEYNHAVYFHDGVPVEVSEVIAATKKLLTLRVPDALDVGLALDWYKVADPDVPPMQWQNTEAGELVNRGKYFSDGPLRREARRQLLTAMEAGIESHPLLRSASSLVTVPGHEANGDSFGERLAKAVGRQRGLAVVETLAASGPRPPAKEGDAALTSADFAMPYALIGVVLIVDDVYRTGATLEAVAQAARAAGAGRVLGFVAARTLRNH